MKLLGKISLAAIAVVLVSEVALASGVSPHIGSLVGIGDTTTPSRQMTVNPDGSINSKPASGSVQTVTGQGTAGSPDTGVVSVQGVGSGTPVPVSSSTFATSAKQDTGNASLTSIDTKLSSQATAANQSAVQSAAGTPNATVVNVQGNASGVALPVSASSLPLPTGAATAANQTSVQSTVAAGTAPTNAVVTGCQYNSALPAPTNGQALARQCDAKGNGRNVIMDGAGNARAANVNASGQLSVTVDNTPSVAQSGTWTVGLTDAATQTCTASSSTTMCTIDTAGYNYATIQTTSATPSTITWTGSNDNSTFAVTYCGKVNDPTQTWANSTQTVALFICTLNGRYLRLSCIYSANPCTAVVVLRVGAQPPFEGTFISPAPAGFGNYSRTRIQSAATTNATSVQASSSNFHGCQLGNNGGSAAYFKIYNKASAPTVGTDTPVETIYLPPGSSQNLVLQPYPYSLSSGFAYAITGGAADSDTTAVAADQVVGACLYR